jgi:hypothetical protein
MAKIGSKRIPRREAALLDPTASRNTDDWQDRDDLVDEAGDLLSDWQEQVAGDEPSTVPAGQVPVPPKPSDVAEQ